jgi:hypothetical protein
MVGWVGLFDNISPDIASRTAIYLFAGTHHAYPAAIRHRMRPRDSVTS